MCVCVLELGISFSELFLPLYCERVVVSLIYVILLMNFNGNRWGMLCTMPTHKSELITLCHSRIQYQQRIVGRSFPDEIPRTPESG